MMKIKYQLVILGQGRETRKEALYAEMKKRFADVGLDFGEHAEVLEGAGKAPEWEGFPVVVWFGGDEKPDPDEVKMAEDFLVRGFSVFPVVESLDNYKSQVPDLLHPINGQVFDVTKLSANVMVGFRLAKRFRQAFISYKRSESSALANQLFHELTERGYRVFLDTVSVDAGLDFQAALWSRMADVDILVLIDSPEALTSKWVHKELLRAETLGMGVVQLIWPNHKRTSGTDFSSPIQLETRDFLNGKADVLDTLSDAKMLEVLNTIEGQRIRSLNSRRTRLVEGIVSNLEGRGVTLLVHPARHVDVMKGADKLAEIVPFVGVPDSFAVYEHECRKEHEQTFVVYNGLGVDEQWAEHLKWLNEKATVEVFQIDDFGTFIGRIA
jgi:hypothetical protein